MKRGILLTLLAFAAVVASAQPILREKTHGLIPGNPNPMIVTTFEEPGVAGEQVTWDFSGLPQVAPFYGDVSEAGVLNPPAQLHKSNTCLVEGDLEAFMVTTRKSLKVLGLRSDEGRMVRTYETPVVKMKYPFEYGDSFKGEVKGTQTYTSGYTYPVQLRYEVKADAYGTLILPGTTLKDVLRVVTKHEIAFSDKENAPFTTVLTYRWYVKEHRFPVLSLIFELRRDGKLLPLKGAYNPIVQLPAEDAVEPETTIAKTDGTVAEVTVRPNPFQESLTVAYSLKGTSNVTIALYNMQGALVRTLMQAKQAEGKYERTFTHQVQQLTPGLYLIRVEAAGNVLSQKVVKVN